MALVSLSSLLTLLWGFQDATGSKSLSLERCGSRVSFNSEALKKNEGICSVDPYSWFKCSAIVFSGRGGSLRNHMDFGLKVQSLEEDGCHFAAINLSEANLMELWLAFMVSMNHVSPPSFVSSFKKYCVRK